MLINLLTDTAPLAGYSSSRELNTSLFPVRGAVISDLRPLKLEVFIKASAVVFVCFGQYLGVDTPASACWASAPRRAAARALWLFIMRQKISLNFQVDFQCAANLMPQLTEYWELKPFATRPSWSAWLGSGLRPVV